ncbi:hypothetical protein [Bradyrhizobium pachyrhizi]|uniref:hypothetical protein n=1 Tax=Bradyrhizobium pachyrhizi TaxID=280333 RepID=UPI0012E3ED73|nr:hypothetical protein [Bradyrhizobium pachyrhizi]
MPKGKLRPEGEVIAAYGAAMVAAFQVLINCLEESDALRNSAQPLDERRIALPSLLTETTLAIVQFLIVGHYFTAGNYFPFRV